MTMFEWGLAGAAAAIWAVPSYYFWWHQTKDNRRDRVAQRRREAQAKQQQLDALAQEYLAKSKPNPGA